MTLRINGSTSGYTEIDALAVAGNNTIQLPAANGNAYQVLRNGATAGTTEFADKIVSGTAVASTSGTSIDFTGIPNWVKRITITFAGVSTNGNNPVQVQIGAGSIATTGYSSGAAACAAGPNIASLTSTVGFPMVGNATYLYAGSMVLTLATGSTWVSSHTVYSGISGTGGGVVALSGTLDRLRIIGSITGTPTDTFDAGTINILYE